MYKKLIVLLANLLLFLPLLTKANNDDFYLAEKHYEQGNYAEAKKCYQKYLDKNKKNIKNSYIRKIVEKKLQAMDGNCGPKENFKYASKAIFNHARKYYHEKNYEKAEELLKEILNNSDFDFYLKINSLKYLVYCKLEKKKIFKHLLIKDIQK
ncbi:MAG: tetratricopeptide repeat protein [Elusimicrobiales bacterium]|nr:tetratricopeptide repeat protein [Elusimicrobiales bacterium]